MARETKKVRTLPTIFIPAITKSFLQYVQIFATYLYRQHARIVIYFKRNNAHMYILYISICICIKGGISDSKRTDLA
ncbi:hypothetical protein F5Y02DRAFT_55786 [Annulohypoxylon stygium]|nr:hypothetical protein F5Y02DRAFT_55786 [Annulohypoxylon stygium]